MRVRMLAAFFLIILLNTVLLIVSLVMGYGNSRRYWNYLNEQESRKVVMRSLAGVVEAGGVLDKETAPDLLDGYELSLINTAQIILFSPEGEILKDWHNPAVTTYTPQDGRLTEANPLYYKDELRGYVEIIPLKFKDVDYNNVFISRIIQLMTLGLIFSTALSFLLAYSISERFTKEARNTVRSLMNLAAGSRKETFKTTSTQELTSINEAAVKLQNILIKEEERRKRWSTSIAHDLRTPLTAMRTQFTACRDGALVLDDKRWEKIIGELDVIESLTRDFLILGDLEANGRKLAVKLVKSESLRLSIIDTLQGQIEKSGITINWNSKQDTILCDFDLTSRVLEALVKNALQHASTFVDISVSGTREKPIITVENEGHIPDEHLDHLFDPLYKTDNSRKKQGSGVGLTIASRIASCHRGSIHVENLANGRVCFTFSLNID